MKAQSYIFVALCIFSIICTTQARYCATVEEVLFNMRYKYLLEAAGKDKTNPAGAKVMLRDWELPVFMLQCKFMNSKEAKTPNASKACVDMLKKCQNKKIRAMNAKYAKSLIVH